MNILDALRNEIDRNKELVEIYKTIPTGGFGKMMIERDIKLAEDAIAEVGDGITFSVNINIAMSEMQGWHPQRIAAFFEGLAKVVSAKEGSKEESSDK